MMTRSTRENDRALNNSEIEKIELSLLMKAINDRYGYDFEDYAQSSVTRRIMKFLSTSEYLTISEMIPRLLHDEGYFARLVEAISVPVTEMFRDPEVYRALRTRVVPLLRTYPSFKIWFAGCASGEEVYSLSILLKEENLLDRASMYATDFNEAILQKAKTGSFPVDRIDSYAKNYREAACNGTFSDYYEIRGDYAVMNPVLTDGITFANHNLAYDQSLGEMHLIFCRNVFIYFGSELKNRVLKMLSSSLVFGGFLCVGKKESLSYIESAADLEVFDPSARIYKKVRP